MILNQFGKRLAFLRKQKGFTQQELAESSDYSVEFISLVERGLNGPTLKGIEKLAQALSIQPKDLFDFKV
jgi:transcriptional regulator with XRE-family HTH domain